MKIINTKDKNFKEEFETILARAKSDIKGVSSIVMNIIDEIQTDGEREAEDYSILMYIVKKDDTLWKIAKRFGSTVEDIVRINGIEDENKIYPDQKLFIPHYSKASVKEYA